MFDSSVPYIFIHKDMNIFISGRSVGSIRNGICFLVSFASKSIAGWYISFFLTNWFLNQFRSFVPSITIILIVNCVFK